MPGRSLFRDWDTWPDYCKVNHTTRASKTG
jgi:hypothetical protein